MTRVYLTTNQDGHEYIIPYELKDEFEVDLKGKEYFTYGFEWVKRDQIMVREPVMFKVAQEYAD